MPQLDTNSHGRNPLLSPSCVSSPLLDPSPFPNRTTGRRRGVPMCAREGSENPRVLTEAEFAPQSLGLPSPALHIALRRHGWMAAAGFGETTLRLQTDAYTNQTGCYDVQSHLKCTQNLQEGGKKNQGQFHNPVNQSLLKVSFSRAAI